MANVINRRANCRACGTKKLDLVFSLKPSPIGDAYVGPEQLDISQPCYPIDLYICSECGLAQLLDVIDPDVLYGDYIYVTASSMGLSEHFQEYADTVLNRTQPTNGALVIDIGCNDGTLLNHFKIKGMRVLGIEPASHIAAQVNANGIKTIAKFFTPQVAKDILSEHGQAKIITANNVFANIDDLASWIEAIKVLMAPDGIFIFESFYLSDLVENMVFDFIYHEHLSAFSVRPIKSLFERAGLELIAAQRVATKGGSLRYFVQRLDGPYTFDGSVDALLENEEKCALYHKKTYDEFSAKIDHLKQELISFLDVAKLNSKSVVGFGASITCTTLIHHFEIGHYLDYLVDDNPAKQGRYSPRLHLPVLPTTALIENKPDYVISLAWRFSESFIRNSSEYLNLGGAIVIPVPEFKVIKFPS